MGSLGISLASNSLDLGKKNIRNSINSYNKIIDKHKQKIEDIRNSNLPEEIKKERIHHWQAEINIFEKNRGKKQNKLNRNKKKKRRNYA